MPTELFPDAQPDDLRPEQDSRRTFMKQAGGLLGLALAPPFAAQAERLASYAKTVEGVSTLQLKVNG
ncbi:hypothetical protein EI291_21290, partial [Hymenobacter rigui]